MFMKKHLKMIILTKMSRLLLILFLHKILIINGVIIPKLTMKIFLKATEAIYADKPDLDWAISLLETFEGTQERINEQFDAYKMRYQDEMLTDIKMIQYGGWTLLEISRRTDPTLISITEHGYS